VRSLVDTDPNHGDEWPFVGLLQVEAV